MIDKLRQRVKPLASMKLTVVLIALSMVLIFAGTWAQIDLGIWTVLTKYFRTWWVWVPFQIFLPRDWDVAGGFPFPGGYIIGGLLLANLLAAHFVRFKWYPKRVGVILIHLSLIMLLVGELVTALYASEANMNITEGQTVNFTQNIHEMELAVIDHSAPDKDRVVVVPEAMLKTGAIIADPQLPFEIHVDDYMFNSTTLGPFQVAQSDKPDRKPRATRGLAAENKIVFQQLPPVSGVESNTVDAASALVSLYDKGKPLGTWGVSLLISGGQHVQVGDKAYHIALRFKREYKPYSMHLIDFRFDRYLGTNTPRNYSSQVRLIDPSRDEDREVLIYMNNPLRYRGETFFQASFKPDETTTILQVVRNPGWLLPYFACTIGAIGMLIHFGIQLTQFLRRRAAGALADSTARPGLVAVATAIVIGLVAVPVMVKVAQRDADDALQRVGQLPVVDQGRIKPLDTLARISLMSISTKQTWKTNGTDGGIEPDDMKDAKGATALAWMLDVMAKPVQARDYKVFRIDHPQVLALLGEEPEQRKYFSMAELQEAHKALDEQMAKARKVESKDRNLFQRKLAQLSTHIGQYMTLESFGGMILVPADDHEGHDHAEIPDEEWTRLGDAHQLATAHNQENPIVDTYIAMFKGWHEDSSGDFAAAAASLQQQIDEKVPAKMPAVRFEAMFNKIEPFYRGIVLYMLAFVLTILSWLKLGWRRPLGRAVFALILVALAIHTFGLMARIYIQDRPPVTNLYSSAVFIGWGAVILGLGLECFYRNTIGSVTAAALGFVTLIIAHNLSLDGDTMTMMQAVLDTNFWLATHVVVITLGYAATFLAGFLAIVYIFAGVFTQALTDEYRKAMSRKIYGILAFAILFSFVGTILGGIWADQSWGRFWGWDPKENGALLIVLWNALVLHARWGGMARERGIAVLAVGGNIITCWSWFGTNMLGVGLHSYGFMDKALLWMLIFVASQLLIMAVGLAPLTWWRSLRDTQRAPAGAALPEPAA